MRLILHASSLEDMLLLCIANLASHMPDHAATDKSSHRAAPSYSLVSITHAHKNVAAKWHHMQPTDSNSLRG